MRKKLLTLFNTLEEERNSLFSILNDYNDESINQQPGPQKWSAQQVINHLILSEKHSVGYCQKKLSFNPDLKNAGIGSAIKAWTVINYFKLPLKINAPKGIDTPALPTYESIEETKRKWKIERENMKQFLENVDNQYLDKELYKHPFAGRLTLQGMMKFFIAHFRHHRKQIDKALNHH
ncbi:MAG: DinB family protein [Saprospiraceae bacterium]|nr:DinB family protein [Saprospiraceae bacterium]